MRGYDPTEVDALLERARTRGGRPGNGVAPGRREGRSGRTPAFRRAGGRAYGPSRGRGRLSQRLERRRRRSSPEARAEAADLRAAADIEIRTAIQVGRTRMLDEVASLEAERDLLAEGIEVTAEHVAAHRDRLLKAVEDHAGRAVGR